MNKLERERERERERILMQTDNCHNNIFNDTSFCGTGNAHACHVH